MLDKDGKLCKEEFLEVIERADLLVSASLRWSVIATTNPKVSLNIFVAINLISFIGMNAH